MVYIAKANKIIFLYKVLNNCFKDVTKHQLIGKHSIHNN